MKVYKDVDIESVPISPNILIFDSMKLEKSIYEYIPLPIQIQMYDMLHSVKWMKDQSAKKEEFDKILARYGFRSIACGTNRLVYDHIYDNRIVLKVAFGNSGISDGYNELTIQEYLKPFVCKTFDVGYKGVCSLHEKIVPIKHQEQLNKVSDMHFDLIMSLKRNGYLLDDIGTRAFMNLGIREGFGLVICDYPTVYKIKEGGITCRLCGGRIDYDVGFNRIVCKTCGKSYTTQELAEGTLKSYESIKMMSAQIGGNSKMKLIIKNPETGAVIFESNREEESKKFDKPKKAPNPFKDKSERLNLKITFPEGTKIQKEPVAIRSKKDPGKKVWQTKEVEVTDKLAAKMGAEVFHPNKELSENEAADSKDESIVAEPENKEEEVKMDPNTIIMTPAGPITAGELENINKEAPSEEDNSEDSGDDEAPETSSDISEEDIRNIASPENNYEYTPKQQSKKKAGKRRHNNKYNLEDF